MIAANAPIAAFLDHPEGLLGDVDLQILVAIIGDDRTSAGDEGEGLILPSHLAAYILQLQFDCGEGIEFLSGLRLPGGAGVADHLIEISVCQGLKISFDRSCSLVAYSTTPDQKRCNERDDPTEWVYFSSYHASSSPWEVVIEIETDLAITLARRS
jgi:hypothetical protein